SSNTFIGTSSDFTNTIVSSNTALGSNADVVEASITNATSIGANAKFGASDSLVLGATGTNVGIGTSTPTARLHVVGNALITVVLTAQSDLGASGNVSFGGNALFSGNVGIGGGNGNARLQIDNAGNTVYAHSTSGLAIWARSEQTDAALFEGTTHFTRSIRVDELGGAGSTTLCRNSINQIASCSSSLRYKTNIGSFNYGVDLIKRLRPITFDWKQGGMHDLGLGAE